MTSHANTSTGAASSRPARNTRPTRQNGMLQGNTLELSSEYTSDWEYELSDASTASSVDDTPVRRGRRRRKLYQPNSDSEYEEEAVRAECKDVTGNEGDGRNEERMGETDKAVENAVDGGTNGVQGDEQQMAEAVENAADGGTNGAQGEERQMADDDEVTSPGMGATNEGRMH